MVIQRWQSVLLLIASVLMCLLTFTPLAKAADATPIGMSHAPVLLVVNILVAVLLFIAIFLFKNLKLQMRVTLISIVLMVCLAVSSGFVLYAGSQGAEIMWTGGVLLLLVALVCAVGGLRLMRRDRNILRSYDRLR